MLLDNSRTGYMCEDSEIEIHMTPIQECDAFS